VGGKERGKAETETEARQTGAAQARRERGEREDVSEGGGSG
jgi:hypothetical protein